jgi:hypothetical protein
MNWDAIGAGGEVLGAIAVFMSLLYLALQIKNQNKESRMNAMHDISIGFRDAITHFASADIADILVRANKDYASLTEVEAQRLIILFGQLFRAWEEAFFQYEAGRLDDRSWSTMLKYYVKLLSMPAFQHAWSLRKDYLDDGFVTFVDSQSREENYRIR